MHISKRLQYVSLTPSPNGETYRYCSVHLSTHPSQNLFIWLRQNYWSKFDETWCGYPLRLFNEVIRFWGIWPNFQGQIGEICGVWIKGDKVKSFLCTQCCQFACTQCRSEVDEMLGDYALVVSDELIRSIHSTENTHVGIAGAHASGTDANFWEPQIVAKCVNAKIQSASYNMHYKNTYFHEFSLVIASEGQEEQSNMGWQIVAQIIAVSIYAVDISSIYAWYLLEVALLVFGDLIDMTICSMLKANHACLFHSLWIDKVIPFEKLEELDDNHQWNILVYGSWKFLC